MSRRCTLSAASCFAIAALLWLPALRADEPAKSPSEVTPEEIAALVAGLGDGSVKERQSAEERLLAIGFPAMIPLEQATRSDQVELRLRATAVLNELRKRRLGEAEVHAVGLYEAGSDDGRVVVRIESAARPVVLVVCAYETVNWEIRPGKGVELVTVIASGYHPQKVFGVNVPVQSTSAEGGRGTGKYFFAYLPKSLRYRDLCDRVRELTGKEVSSFQGRYDSEGKGFVVGAK